MNRPKFDAFQSSLSYKKHREKILSLCSPFRKKQVVQAPFRLAKRKSSGSRDKEITPSNRKLLYRIREINTRPPRLAPDSSFISRSRKLSLSASRIKEIKIPLERKISGRSPYGSEIRQFESRYLQRKKNRAPARIESLVCRGSSTHSLSRESLQQASPQAKARLPQPMQSGRFLLDLKSLVDFTSNSGRARYRISCLGHKTPFLGLEELTSQAIVLNGRKAFVLWLERLGTAPVLIGSCSVRLEEGSFKEELTKTGKIAGRVKGVIHLLEK
jgi:hypothetical protein